MDSANTPVSLPIDPFIPEILGDSHISQIISATPGSGKTTRIPPAIAKISEKRVLCVEPRRLACIAAASRISDECGTKLGDFVGYHVRMDKKCSASTKLCFVTTGMLLQYLCADPFLDDISCVILDEFHERSIDADICLGMLRYLQREARNDLKLIVMSATLDSDALARYLDDARVFSIEAPIYPLEIRYMRRACSSHFYDYSEDLMQAIESAAAEQPGDILVFQPGLGDIRQAIDLAQNKFGGLFECEACHASLPLAEQKRILQPQTSKRRIIFSTNVAESSLTIPGIQTVIDTGFAKRKFFDSISGLSRLETQRISRASAEQRAGRAARLGPGLCIRLWNDAIQNQLEPQSVPEIERLDLSQAWLQMAAWGLESPDTLPLITPPAPGRMADAKNLLIRLGAIDPDSESLTPLGQQMAKLPLEPRLARWLIAASKTGCIKEASLLAAFLSEAPYRRSMRDKWPGPDLFEDFLKLRKAIHAPENAALKRTADDILNSAGELALSAVRANDLREALGRSLLAAYPDRLAKPRPQKEKLPDNDPRRLTQPIPACMSGNRGVVVKEAQTLKDAKFFICTDLDLVKGVERAASTVLKAFEMDPRWIPWQEGVTARYEPDKDRVVVAQAVYFDIFTLRETFLHDPAYDKLYRKTLLDAALKSPAKVLNFESDAWKQFDARLQFLKKAAPALEIPVFDESWGCTMLPELVKSASSFEELHAIDLTKIARQQLDPMISAQLRSLAPERITLENGYETDVDYTLDPPVIRVKIQKAFGTWHLPRIGGGKIMVMIHLCAPSGRAAQVTQDIENFWKNTYADVRKLLRGRYPKHDWPEIPPPQGPLPQKAK